MVDYETYKYVTYNTANNVSNFGGDPVTQLIVNAYQMKFIPQIHMQLPLLPTSRTSLSNSLSTLASISTFYGMPFIELKSAYLL